MLATIRKLLIEKLWKQFTASMPNYSHILPGTKLVLDHLAIIDLPSKNSGVSVLQKIFAALGFVHQGAGYLPHKLNDFIWMAPEDNVIKAATDSLPQLVLADFRLNLLSKRTQIILERFIEQIEPFDFVLFKKYLQASIKDRAKSIDNIVSMVYEYVNSRRLELPTRSEYNYIKSENELIAWVTLFGRKVNHFGISVHLMTKEKNLQSFNQYLTAMGVELNYQGGEVKGSQIVGIEQSSSLGRKLVITLEGGRIEARDSFLEFVWRYSTKSTPNFWSDYFTGFSSSNANTVIESLYSTAL